MSEQAKRNVRKRMGLNRVEQCHNPYAKSRRCRDCGEWFKRGNLIGRPVCSTCQGKINKKSREST